MFRLYDEKGTPRKVISLQLPLPMIPISSRGGKTRGSVVFLFGLLCAIIERKRHGKEDAMRLFIDDKTIAEMKKALRKETNIYRISMMGFG